VFQNLERFLFAQFFPICPLDLLTGAGRVAKTIWLEKPSDINGKAIKYYMTQALAHDEEHNIA
jgi:hypothetical protein